jgi:hypothetical protein
MKFNKFKYLLFLMLPALIVACSKEETDLPAQDKFVKVDELVSSGSLFNVQFYAKDSLFVGYNIVYFKLTDKNSGQPLDQATIELFPLMDMGTFKHSCPFENPAETADADGYFEGAVMFSMPGSDNSWSLAALISANGETDSVFFPLEKVIATSPVKKIVVIDSLNNGPGSWIITKYPVSIVEPPEWKVGNNKFEITINTMASMMSFPCCDDISVEIIPEMPSMGHGSPNNINPVPTGNGHYAGTVNFTMTGAWRVNMVFRKDGRTLGRNAYFDINF